MYRKWVASSLLPSYAAIVAIRNTELTLSERRWTCAGCGAIHDRDWNASKNIEQEALKLAYA